MPLIIVATPLGNLNDVSPRVRQALSDADVVAAEDTRVTRRLYAALGLHAPRLLSYRAHEEVTRAVPLADRVEEGQRVVLVSDAGLPGVSDPGAALVALCHARGLAVELVPGPSAVGAAVAASGFPGVPFHFLGFPPRKAGPLRRWLRSAGSLTGVLVLFESPRRITSLVTSAAQILPDREGCLCRELTKRNEELLRMPLPGLAANLSARDSIRGEVVLVIGPGEAPEQESTPELDSAGLKPIAAALAKRWGVSRRDAYQRLLALEKAL
jgi:16S rRNA (cytidine1402-2'-O)-methyltransferase